MVWTLLLEQYLAGPHGHCTVWDCLNRLGLFETSNQTSGICTLSLPWPCSILVLLGWARICRLFKEPRNRFPAWWNWFLGIDSWAPWALTNTGFGSHSHYCTYVQQQRPKPVERRPNTASCPAQLEEVGGGAMIRSIQRCNTMATLTFEEFRLKEATMYEVYVL